jgi:transcription factor C subunit 7
MSWSVDPYAIRYYSQMPTPTGLPTDPALSSYGERQAEQLGVHLTKLSPPIDQIISSPYYRCLQTLKPGVLRLQKEKGYKNGVLLESGFEEWYGATGDHREQPGPCGYEELKTDHFPELNLRWEPLRRGDVNERGGDGVIRPNRNGESVEGLHDRVAYALHKTIERADREGWKAIVICMHAAVMIAIGRALTGRMPEDYTEEDFRCFTASMSKYQRRKPYRRGDDVPASGEWDHRQQHVVPEVPWRDGIGVMGGWDSALNADCSYLLGGEERGWHFSGDESFLTDPNAFNDKENEAKLKSEGVLPGDTSENNEEDDLNLNRALCTAVADAENEIGEKVMDDIRNGRSKL